MGQVCVSMSTCYVDEVDEVMKMMKLMIRDPGPFPQTLDPSPWLHHGDIYQPTTNKTLLVY